MQINFEEVVIQVVMVLLRKKDLTGAVTVLTSEDFNKGPVTSADQMITGKVAGTVINGGGSPGEGATIRIRSGSSLSATMTLYMLLIMFQLRPVVSTEEEPLTTINQNNIESILF
jgi:iron complex outermembrane receptor protein